MVKSVQPPGERFAASGFFVGVDCRGLKTQATIYNRSGRFLDENYAGPANLQTVGLERAVENIVSAILNTARIAHLDLRPGDIAVMAVGMPGVENVRLRTSVEKALAKRRLLKHTSILVLTDIQVVLRGLAPKGAALLIKTGPRDRIFGRNAGENEFQADGRNSASHLVTTAIDAVYDAASGDGPSTSLFNRLLRHFDANSIDDLTVELAYFNQTEQIRTVKEILPIVSEEAHRGDPVANRVCFSTANCLAETTNLAIRSLNIKSAAFPIGLLGDVWSVGDPLKHPFLSAVHDIAPKAFVVEPNMIDSARCAALIAIDSFGV